MANILRRDSAEEKAWSAVAAIGPRWPYRHLLVEWLGDPRGMRIESGHVYGWLLGAVGGGHPAIRARLWELAQDDRRMGPHACALAALAVGWPDDPATRLLVMQYAANPHPDHRGRFALEVLAQHFPDAPETLPLLLRLAQSREGWYVRYAAVSVLGVHFHERPEVLELLVEAAGPTEREANVRWAALTALGEHCRADARVLPLLLDRAATGPRLQRERVRPLPSG